MSDGQTYGEIFETAGVSEDTTNPSLMLLHQALDGKRGNDQKRIAVVGLAWLATLLRKNHDYESSAWQIPTLLPELSVGDAILVRMSDKINRLSALHAKPGEVTDESFSDTMGDLGSYALLWLSRPDA
jgi:hypothetical protein